MLHRAPSLKLPAPSSLKYAILTRTINGPMPARISFVSLLWLASSGDHANQPQYRPTGQSRRSARANHDNDVFEGLPVRRWHREWVGVGKPAAPVNTPQTHLGMPREASLLPETAQALLQAARSGSSNSEVPKVREIVQSEPMFKTKRWVRYPRDQEPPEPVYLAKVPDAPGKKVQMMGSINGDADAVVSRKRAPPPPKKKKRPGRKPGFKKQVAFIAGQEVTQEGDQITALSMDTEMRDVDAVAKEDPVPENAMAKEIERAEEATEALTLQQKKKRRTRVTPFL